nr:uncharacterized protein LOC127347085 [Lolium perenne]
MSSATPPPTSEPIVATPISSAPPPFAPVHLDPIKDSGKDTEGTSANPEKASGEEQAEQKAEEIAAKKSKARQRDSEAKGKWWPCTTTETELKNLEAEGFLLPGSWRTVPGSLAPAPQDGEMVLEALEEGELRTLLRAPQTGNTDPEAASEAEAPEAPRLSKRKKAAPSSPAAKRACEAPSIAATRKLEAEKKRLKMIDTSNRAQPNIQQFFIPTGKSSGSQAPKITKKRVKSSPASIPVTPEVEVPPKASSAAKSDPKDVINVDDLPEDPIVESDKGDSGKGASSSAPPPEQPTATYTAVPTDLVDRKLRLSDATGTPQTHPHFFPVLQKVPLSQRHTEISAMMEQVWGPANTEEQEMNELEGGIKAFFAKHKNVRQHTWKLHEDLRTHVLEQRQEIELLQTRDADNQKAIALLETHIKGFEDEIAKRPSIDSLSAKIEVLEAENESLKKFLKESSEEETKKKKELLEKHAQELSDLAEKLKRSQQRIQTLAAKNKDYEAEAERALDLSGLRMPL